MTDQATTSEEALSDLLHPDSRRITSRVSLWRQIARQIEREATEFRYEQDSRDAVALACLIRRIAGRMEQTASTPPPAEK